MWPESRTSLQLETSSLREREAHACSATRVCRRWLRNLAFTVDRSDLTLALVYNSDNGPQHFPLSPTPPLSRSFVTFYIHHPSFFSTAAKKEEGNPLLRIAFI